MNCSKNSILYIFSSPQNSSNNRTNLKYYFIFYVFPWSVISWSIFPFPCPRNCSILMVNDKMWAYLQDWCQVDMHISSIPGEHWVLCSYCQKDKSLNEKNEFALYYKLPNGGSRNQKDKRLNERNERHPLTMPLGGW